MDEAEVREWCHGMVSLLNVVETELELRLDHDQIQRRVAEIKIQVAELLKQTTPKVPA